MRQLSKVNWPPLFYVAEAAGRSAQAGAPPPAAGGSGHVELLKFILEKDKQDNLFCTADRGRTALMVAAMHDAAAACTVLCEAHPWAVNLRDAGGRTAMHWAATKGATAAMDAILRAGGGSSTNARDAQGKTPGDLLSPWYARGGGFGGGISPDCLRG